MTVSESTEDVVPNLDHREGWCSLIAQCDAETLCATVDQIISEIADSVQIRVTNPAQTGTVQLPIREPVCEERFLLADALVTIAEVAINDTIGWCMRLGSDKKATTAGAVADALLTLGTLSSHQTLTSSRALITLLADTRRDLIESRASEWQELGQTIIEFEELD